MPRKRKPKPFKAATAVRSLARERLGSPPPTIREKDRRTEKSRKHKPTLGKLLAEE